MLSALVREASFSVLLVNTESHYWSELRIRVNCLLSSWDVYHFPQCLINITEEGRGRGQSPEDEKDSYEIPDNGYDKINIIMISQELWK